MSVVVRRALYGALAGDTTLTGMLATAPSGYSKSIFFEVAPETATFPYLIFNQQSGTPTYAMKANAFDNEIWLVKGVDQNMSADVVDNIASRLDALLTDGTLSISGKTQLYLRRMFDVNYMDVQDGVLYRHAGAEFRLVYQTT